MSSGNYSRDMHRERKRYIGTLVQRGVPWVDADENDRTKILRQFTRRALQRLIGDGSPEDAFKIVGEGLSNDFSVVGTGSGATSDGDEAGFMWFKGFPCSLFDDFYYTGGFTGGEINVNSTNLTDDTLEDSGVDFTLGGDNDNLVGRTLVPSTQDGTEFVITGNTANTITVDISGGTALTDVAEPGDAYRVGLSTPTAARTDTVWLDIHVADWGVDKDEDLAHTFNEDVEAQRREKLVQNIRVVEGDTTAPEEYTDTNGNRHFLLKLATIERDSSGTITADMVIDERPDIVPLQTFAANFFTDDGDIIEEAIKSRHIADGNVLERHLRMLRPAPTDPVGMSLKVEQGFYPQVEERASIFVPEQTSPAFTEPTADPRIDLLVIDDTGGLSIIEGTEGIDPTPPDYPRREMAIAEVKLQPDTTAIDTEIFDLSSSAEGYRDVRPLIKWKNNGYRVSDGATFAESEDDELLTKEIIAGALEVSARGIRGSSTYPSDLPLVSDINNDPDAAWQEHDLYTVRHFEDTDIGRSDVIDQSADEEFMYPSGLWWIVDDTGDGNFDYWDFVAPMGSSVVDMIRFLDRNENGSRWRMFEDSNTGNLRVEYVVQDDESLIHSFVFDTDGNLEVLQELYVDGGLGVGTDSPSHKVQVVGEVRASSFRSALGTKTSPAYKFNDQPDSGIYLTEDGGGDTQSIGFSLDGGDRYYEFRKDGSIYHNGNNYLDNIETIDSGTF